MASDAARLDNHGERIAVLENEAENTRRLLDEIKAGQLRIFSKLDELNRSFAERPAQCSAEWRRDILEATQVLGGKIDRMSARLWRMVGLVLAVPAAIVALVFLGKTLLLWH